MTQFIVIYTKDGEVHVYDSAYTPAQSNLARVRCQERHGHARVVEADRYPPRAE